jgi:hypothetical protein
MKKILLWLLPLIILLHACKKDKDADLPTTKGVYIVNEGGFNFGNAEVSFYNPENGEVSNNLFNAANGYSLGDVAQSMYIKDSIGFIVVNNSQKVEVVKIPSLQVIRTITIAGSSPRYILPVNDNIAYVTDLYASKVYVVNYQTGIVLQQINTPTAWTEHILLNGTDLLVEGRELSSSTTHNSGLLVINTTTNSITNNYKLNSANVNGIVKDKYGNIWLAKDADSTQGLIAKFYCLNASYTVIDSIVFATGHHPSNLCMSADGERLFYFDRDVNSVPVSGSHTPQIFANASNLNLYGMGVNPSNGDVYFSNSLDYVQPSQVYRYSSTGQLLGTFNAGIISGNFAFSYE